MSDITSLAPGLARDLPLAGGSTAAVTPQDPAPAQLGDRLPGFPGAVLSIYFSLAACEAAWRQAAADGACYAFQCFEWQAAFQATIGAAERVLPVIAHLVDAQGRTLLLLPLGVYRQGRLRVLSFLGGVVTDYGAPIVSPEFAEQVETGDVGRLLGMIVKRAPRVDLVWLRRMPEAIQGVRNPIAALERATHTEDAQALHLPESPDGLRASASSRRNRRQLAKHGPVEFRSPAPDSPEAAAIVAVLERQKSRRWRETACRDLFAEPAYRDFYRSLSHQKLQEGAVHVCALYVGEDIVAAHWGLAFRGRFYFLLVGRDDGELARHSPGKLLIEDLVTWCIDQDDIRIFDLTAGDEGYKRDWSDHTLALFEYLAPTSLLGAAFMARRRLHALLKQNRRLRNWVRRRRGSKPV